MRGRRALPAWLLALTLLLAPGAHAAAPEVPAAPDAPDAPDRAQVPCLPLARGAKITVDLNDAPLSAVARLVSCAAARNILFSPASLAERRVTVISARAVDRGALIALWHALLAQQSLVAERHGAYEVVRPVAL